MTLCPWKPKHVLCRPTGRGARLAPAGTRRRQGKTPPAEVHLRYICALTSRYAGWPSQPEPGRARRDGDGRRGRPTRRQGDAVREAPGQLRSLAVSGCGRRVLGFGGAVFGVDAQGLFELVFEDDDAAGGLDGGAVVDQFPGAGGDAQLVAGVAAVAAVGAERGDRGLAPMARRKPWVVPSISAARPIV